MSWLDCTTRPPGYYGSGRGPGGGGDGNGGCVGNGCDDDGACNDREYFKCDKTIPQCVSVGFKSPENVGVTDGTCTFPDYFDTGTEEWYLVCPPCGPILCDYYICDDLNPDDPNDCTLYQFQSNSSDMANCNTTGDLTTCPTSPTCGINSIFPPKTGYKDPEICRTVEPNCQGIPGFGDKCWECVDDPDQNFQCCVQTCDFVYDADSDTYVCPQSSQTGNTCYVTPQACNPNCTEICYECEVDFETGGYTGNCVEVTGIDCNNESCEALGYFSDSNCNDQCVTEYCASCVKWECATDNPCDPLTGSQRFEDCVTSSIVYSENSDSTCGPRTNLCNSATGEYTGDGVNTFSNAQEAAAECISCNIGVKCTEGSEGLDDTCDQDDFCTTNPTGIPEENEIWLCNYTQDCWPDDDSCYQNACECPSYVVCPKCIEEALGQEPSADCDTCVTCNPIGRDETTEQCEYDDTTLLCDTVPGLTCQTAIKGAYSAHDSCNWKCGPNKDCADASLACNNTCPLNTKCWECKDDTGSCECEQTCTRDFLGECPTDCHETPTDCEGTCKQDCWTCVITPGGVEGGGGSVKSCKKIKVSCGPTCESLGHYSTEQDCKDICGASTGENQFDDNDDAKNLVYKYKYVDSVYERNLSNQKYAQLNTPFTPVNRGSLSSELFKPNVHASIYATDAMNNASSMLFSDFPYSDITNAHLERSLDLELVRLLNEVKLATGESIKRSVFGMIRNLIISNRLHTLDVNELKRMLKRVKEQQSDLPDTRGTYSLPGTHASEAQALKLAGQKAWDIHPDSYQGVTSEKMRLWKTIATDLDKNLPVRLSDGSMSQLYYSVSDTIPLDGSGTMTLSPGDVQEVGPNSYIEIDADYDRARILQLEDLQKVCNLLGQEYSFTMNVKTDETLRVDERYGVANERKDFYMLTLDLSTIEDLERDNPFVARTKVKYKYETNGPARNDWIRYRPWPYMVFYVDADDPIFNYITNDGDITITSTDFVTDLFEDDPTMMRFIRRLPWTVVLIPSDKSDKVYSHVISTQTAYGERELKFLVNPDPKRSDTWDAPHLREHFSNPDPGVNPSKPRLNAVYYNVYTDKLNSVDKYTNGTPTLPRPYFGMRQVLATLKDFKDNYEVQGNTVNWPQVYENIPRSKMKNLYQEVPDWERFKTRAAFGKISTVDSVNENYPRVKDVRSNNKTIIDVGLNDYAKAARRPDNEISPPPGPLE